MTSERSSDKKQNNICLLRGGNEMDDNFNDWNLGESGFGRQSFQRNSQLPKIQYYMDRESQQKQQQDEELVEKKSIISMEDQILQKQSIQSFQSRGSNFILFNRFSGYNVNDQVAKNSLTFSQTFEQQQKFSLEKSEKSYHNNVEQQNSQFRQSNQSNRKSKENECEIVFEWQEESDNQNAIEDLINKLTLEKQCDIIPDRLSLIPSSKQGCICKKTQCLKLYCQCFQQAKLCRDTCECLDCCNNEQNKELIEQTRTQLNRNINDSIKCFCKKSKCLKKYCECYNAGKKCGVDCKCENCMNQEINLHEAQRLSEFQIQQQKRVQLS